MWLTSLQQKFLLAMMGATVEPIQALINPKYKGLQRLAIYQNNSRFTLIKTLQAIYPICYRLVGAEFFQGMAKAYIAKIPSSTVDLNNYGESFAEFIKVFLPAKDLPYLMDMAHFEWAWHKISLAPFTKPLNNLALQQLNSQQWAQVIFNLPVGSTLFFSTYPIFKIWQDHQALSDEAITIDLQMCKEYLLITMIYQEPDVLVLEKSDWDLLQAIQAKPLAELANFKNSNVISRLANFISRGCLTGFSIAP